MDPTPGEHTTPDDMYTRVLNMIANSTPEQAAQLGKIFHRDSPCRADMFAATVKHVATFPEFQHHDDHPPQWRKGDPYISKIAALIGVSKPTISQAFPQLKPHEPITPDQQ